MKRVSLRRILTWVFVLTLAMLISLTTYAEESNLISHWKLESDGTNSVEGAGDLVIPESGVEFEMIDGHKGMSVSRGSVIYRHDWDVNIGSNFTIAMFVKSAPYEGYEILLAKGRKDEECHFEVYLESGYLNLYAPSLGDLRSGYNINDDTIHHIAITYDGQNAIFYVDGVNVKNIEIEGSITDGVGEAVMIGLLVEQNFGYEGFISDVRIYDKALEENDIKSLAGVEETEPETEPQPETDVSILPIMMLILAVSCITVLIKKRRVEV